jgi:hypothetical protein
MALPLRRLTKETCVAAQPLASSSAGAATLDLIGKPQFFGQYTTMLFGNVLIYPDYNFATIQPLPDAAHGAMGIDALAEQCTASH